MACNFRPYRFRTVSYGTNGRFRRMIVNESGFNRYTLCGPTERFDIPKQIGDSSPPAPIVLQNQ
jgi:hypothetical protein